MSISTPWILCAGTIPRAGFRERVDAAARVGFSGITLFPEHYLDAMGGEQLDSKAIARCLRDAGIVVQQLDPLLDWYGPGPSKSELLLYEAAEVTGARSINTAPALAPSDDLRFLCDRLGALGERARLRDISIDLEFLPWSPIPTLEVALSIVRDCGLSNVGVMLDSWHFFRGGGRVSDLTPDLVSRITGVQLNDAPLVPASPGLRARWDRNVALLGWARNGCRTLGARDFIRLARSSAQSPDPSVIGETLTRRLLPGEGEQPVKELVSTLLERGCPASMGVEAFNSELHRLPVRDAAARAMNACRRIREIDPQIVSDG